MKKLGKNLEPVKETVEAYCLACLCDQLCTSCGPDSASSSSIMHGITSSVGAATYEF